MFHSLKIKNRGIAYSTSNDILKRINQIASTHPKKLFLMVGINDIGNNIPIDTVFSNFTKIAETVRTISPSTKLYVQSTLPSIPPEHPNDIIKMHNQNMKSYCNKNHVTYIDLYPSFVLNSQINPSLTYDGLHLNGNGYFLWKSLIKQYISEP